jgi:hypothetical protein
MPSQVQATRPGGHEGAALLRETGRAVRARANVRKASFLRIGYLSSVGFREIRKPENATLTP